MTVFVLTLRIFATSAGVSAGTCGTDTSVDDNHFMCFPLLNTPNGNAKRGRNGPMPVPTIINYTTALKSYADYTFLAFRAFQ